MTKHLEIGEIVKVNGDRYRLEDSDEADETALLYLMPVDADE